jgi:hypothetical protein
MEGGESYFHSVYPIPRPVDERLRVPQMVVPGYYDPLGAINRSELIWASVITGRPGFDYVSPEALKWAQSLTGKTVQFDYSEPVGDTAHNIERNVRAGAGVLYGP